MIKYTYIYFILLLLWIPRLGGQTDLSSIFGAGGLATGNADLTSRDINSTYTNQAGLAYLEKYAFNIFSEKKFSLKELQVIGMSMALPSPVLSGVIGFKLVHFGYSDFNNQKTGVSYSKKLFDNLAMGIQFNLLSTRIRFYGNQLSLGLGIGFQYELIDGVRVGIHLYKQPNSQINSGNYKQVNFQTGITYRPAAYLAISTSVEKDIYFTLNFKGGLEYRTHKKIFFQLGLNTNPEKYCFGAGFLFNKLKFHTAASFHPVLGWSPGFGLSFYLPEKIKDHPNECH